MNFSRERYKVKLKKPNFPAENTMSRHGTFYLLTYRKPNNSNVYYICKLFHFVKIDMIISTRTDTILWVYSYLDTSFACYSLDLNSHVFTNANMYIQIYPKQSRVLYKVNSDAAWVVIENSTIGFYNIEVMPAELLDQLQQELHGLTSLPFNDPIACYWIIVSAAKKHNLVKRLTDL